MVLADLHMHSTASDGQYPPGELAALARAAGVEVMALTDHDTLDGTAEAVRAAPPGMTVLRGVELSAREDRHMHILGLGLAPSCPRLEALCADLRRGREERSQRILAFLAERGMPLTLEEVRRQAGGKVIGRPHFAQVMVARGYVSSTREAFDRYLDSPEFKKIEREKPAAAACIQVIHDGGGKAVLAHPYQLALEDGPLEAVVRQLKGDGLDGLECYYPKHTPSQQAFYLHLAKKYGLQVTGGSDFHGQRVHPEDRFRPVSLDLDWLLPPR